LTDSKKVEYVTGDILDTQFLEDLLEKYKPDVIVNLVGIAQTHHIEPELLFKINFFGVLNLFESVKKLKEKSGYSPKVLHISSSDVYGKTKNTEHIDEDAPFYPVNYYGVSKVAGDRLAYQYSQSQNLNVAIFRPFPHTGPGQKKGFFVPDMVSQLVNIEKNPEKKELMVGNLDAVRDYLDVRDVVKVYASAIEKEFQNGEAFNICSGKGVKIGDLLNKLVSFSSKKIKIVNDPERMRPSEVPTLVGDPSKVMKQFNFRPEIEINETLKDSLDQWRRFN